MSTAPRSPHLGPQRPLVYVWKTSIPKFVLRTRKEDLKHISKTSGPKNTLEFLVETQKYIERIRKPKPSSTPGSPRAFLHSSNAEVRKLRVLLPPKTEILDRPQTVETPRGMCLKVRSYERLGRNTSAGIRGEETQYAITKYMLSRPVSPRFLNLHPDFDSEKLTKLTPSKIYKNNLIDDFLNRFNKK